MNLVRGLALFCAVLSMCIGVAHANTLPVQGELEHARLSGQGAFRWFGFKVYEASLWRESTKRANSSPLEERFILELVYTREFLGKEIAASSIDEIRKLNIGTAQQHAAWLSLMLEVFPDVRAGTRLSGAYLAGQGVRFYRDGVLLREIANAEFSRAFFSIWLDERTSAPRLRKQLLGQSS